MVSDCPTLHGCGSVPTDVGVDWRQCKKCGLDLKGHAGFWDEGDTRDER